MSSRQESVLGMEALILLLLLPWWPSGLGEARTNGDRTTGHLVIGTPMATRTRTSGFSSVRRFDSKHKTILTVIFGKQIPSLLSQICVRWWSHCIKYQCPSDSMSFGTSFSGKSLVTSCLRHSRKRFKDSRQNLEWNQLLLRLFQCHNCYLSFNDQELLSTRWVTWTQEVMMANQEQRRKRENNKPERKVEGRERVSLSLARGKKEGEGDIYWARSLSVQD